MALIPQRFIDDLLDRADIVDVVSSRIDLRKSGKNYTARCPFHNEKTPSFSVSPEKQFYYCFGCGAGGNALGFVMDHDHIGFVDAVESLAKHYGMEVPKEASKDSKGDIYRRKLYNMLADADRYYREQLRSHPEAKRPVDYLKKRGLSGEIAGKFSLGFAPSGWDNVINKLCLDDGDVKLLIDCGLAIRKDEESNRIYDRFRNRIIFPIRDTRGRTIGFGGRVLDDSKPKYLNSPETPVFHKGRELYGLYEAHKELREIDRLMVVEGYMDVVALAQHGIHYAVATLGTAATPEHLEKLFRYTSDVLFCFDGDQAGRNAARRAMETSLPAMTDGRSARFLFLPEGEDPDTLVRKLGKEGFEKLITSALPLSDFLFNTLQATIDIGTMDGKARLSQQAAPLINRIPDGVFKQLMLKELSRRTDLDVDSLRQIITPPTPASSEQLSGNNESHQENPFLQDSTPYQEGPPDFDYGDYEHGSYDDSDFSGTPASTRFHEPAARPSKRLRMKLTPLQRLLLLLLHNPTLRTELPRVETLGQLDDPYAPMLAGIYTLLEENPHYTLNHVLGYWRGIHGPEQGEALAQIAAADMLGSAQMVARDDVSEFRDICQHLNRKLDAEQSPRQQLEAILAKPELGPDDRKRITLLQIQLSKEEKSLLYQQIKDALSKFTK